ncbi:MAG: hypothetical protein GY943_03090 [Chloroflexi bacterium]|nr:hypothetical protein [Chloroflexota bacterium]
MIRSTPRFTFLLLFMSLFAFTIFFQNSSRLTSAKGVESNATTHDLFFPIVITSPRTTTERVSIATDGTEANELSTSPSISADGRFVAFSSSATNLIDNDTNGHFDVFVHDRLPRETVRLSVSSNGTQGEWDSYDPSISADGRFVAFQSDATTLVDNDTNQATDIFVHDRQTGETKRVSVATNGTQGNDHSSDLALSGDGNIVVFESFATNLVNGDTNNNWDIFVHNMQTGVTTLVSKNSNGSQGNDKALFPTISADGHFVTFQSGATNLVNGDTNNEFDVFTHDLQTGDTSRVSVKTDGTQGNKSSFASSVSADGRFVAFESYASNFVSNDTNNGPDVFIHDQQTNETIKVPLLNAGTMNRTPTISANGRFVTFVSWNNHLVDGDIYTYDLSSDAFELVTITTDGNPSRGLSETPVLSADGSIIAFKSFETTLISGDTNNVKDIFVRIIISN